MKQCVIFDFDLTLIDSTPVEDAMKAGNWGAVLRQKNNLKPYEGALSVLSELKIRGIKTAIFSDAPKHYVENVLKAHNLPIDLIVAYHDVKEHKPNPEGIYRVLESLKIKPSEVLYLGDSQKDADAAIAAGVDFVSVTWGSCTDSIPLLDFTTFFEFFDGDSKSSFLKHHEFVLKQQHNHFFLAYYEGDIKQKVWQFKDGRNVAKTFWSKAIRLVDKKLPQIDWVVRALGHQELQHTENLHSEIARTLANCFGAKFKPDLLAKSRVTQKSTTILGGKSVRKTAVDKSYITNAHGDNERLVNILIFDDVFTTGSTTEEIQRSIRDQYPNAVIYIFTLVKTPWGDQHNEATTHNKNFIEFVNSSDDTKVSIVERKISFRDCEKLTANYCNTTSNFIIDNLPKYSILAEPSQAKFHPSISVIKNILCRGLPTRPSSFLLEKLCVDYGAVVSKTFPLNREDIYGDYNLHGFAEQWKREAVNYLLVQSLPRELGKFTPLLNLADTDVRLGDITTLSDKKLSNFRVDLYFHQALIAIDVFESEEERSSNLNQQKAKLLSNLDYYYIQLTVNEIDTFDKDGLIEYLRDNSTDSLVGNDYTLANHTTDYIEQNKGKVIDKLVELTAVVRFQLLLLTLIERGVLKLNQTWPLNVINHDDLSFIELAIEDLNLWLVHIFSLQSLDFSGITYDLSNDGRTADDAVNIDFSVFRYASGRFPDAGNVVYCRSLPIDTIQNVSIDQSSALQVGEFIKLDHFSVAVSGLIDYRLDLSAEGSHRNSLRYFLENIFLPDIPDVDFREGQIEIISTALRRQDTVGLLPTGSGKSICYQLSAILQPAISFVVCPIKSLMQDQKYDLDQVHFNRTNYITGDLTVEQRNHIQHDYSRGKYFFVFISPERFQKRDFRQQLIQLNEYTTIAYAVIDEVHCLSEWGHDFRLSYLNLANAISRYAPDSTYIGLTATASVNVLKDIQSEFNVPDYNVRTPSNFSREELEFDVIQDNGDKSKALTGLIETLTEKWGTDESFAGLVFTPHVNGNLGCVHIAELLSSKLGQEVVYYSGGKPKYLNISDNEFEKYKREVLQGFKDNQHSLITATKAFGMGVNKGNIGYTVHFGMPGSMEALYQEAGRAGREKSIFKDTKANCYVLLGIDNYEKLDKFWEPDITKEELEHHHKKTSSDSDINTNMFMFLNGIERLKDEYGQTYQLYSRYYDPSQLLQRVSAAELGLKKSVAEKCIYRLLQIGVVVDWTVQNFFKGEFEVEFREHTEDDVRDFLECNIRKYEPDFTVQDLIDNPIGKYKPIVSKYQTNHVNAFELYLAVSLLWSYQHFAYNRRQSLKNVYEHCLARATNEITKDALKQALENYFRFDDSTTLLQHVANEPMSYRNWFEIIDSISSDNPESELIVLRDQLSRFLESYQRNTGLNYLSGIIRLRLNEYGDTDGEKRMIAALDSIEKDDSVMWKAVLDYSLAHLAEYGSEEQKALFAKTVYTITQDDKTLMTVNNSLEDDYTMKILIDGFEQRLQKLNHKLVNIMWNTNG